MADSTSVVAPASLPTVMPALLSLAPLRLPQRRNLRYDGGDLCISLERLEARDQTLLRDLYGILNELLYDIADEKTADAEKWDAVVRWTRRHSLNALFEGVRTLGRASREQAGDSEFVQADGEALAKAVHDVRGGALNALLGRLQIHDRLPHDEACLKTLFVLARDHLKIMRNAIMGLDENRRQADMQRKRHDMHLMVDKWHESIVGPKWEDQPIKMVVDCRYEGALTECCLESAAVDRIFYNLSANACRHAVGGRIDMAIFPVPEPAGECVRFVLSNEVNATDAAFLRSFDHLKGGPKTVPDGSGVSLPGLFEPKASSTGSGFGLTVVADFVAGAFGLRDRAEALRERYVGAVLEGMTFRVWFHWPMADATLPRKLDDFHQPEQSLSEPA